MTTLTIIGNLTSDPELRFIQSGAAVVNFTVAETPRKYDARHVRNGGYVPKDIGVLRALIGCDWMSEKGCFLSIPPAFTAFIGAQLLDALPDFPPTT